MGEFVSSPDLDARKSLHVLQRILYSTPDVVCVKDGAGRWLIASDAAIRMFHLDPATYQGQTDREMAENNPLLREAFLYCCQTDEATWAAGRRTVHEEIVPQPGRAPIILETIKTPVFAPDGSRESLLLVGRDVSDRKRMAEEVIRRTVELEKAKELERLRTEFVNTVSHELRTPITTIMGYAEFLEDGLDGELTEAQLASVNQVQASARRLGTLVDDLLDFARIEAGTFRLSVQESDMQRLVEEVRDSLFPVAKTRGIRIETPETSQPLHFRFDRQRIAQVLTNLVGNALKFTPPGGSVTIRTSVAGGAVRVEVIDTGIGIAPGDLTQVFKRFYQAETGLTRKTGGTGLGLSIVKALVETHGGEVGAESQPGRGSTFWFELPIA